MGGRGGRNGGEDKVVGRAVWGGGYIELEIGVAEAKVGGIGGGINKADWGVAETIVGGTGGGIKTGWDEEV